MILISTIVNGLYFYIVLKYIASLFCPIEKLVIWIIMIFVIIIVVLFITICILFLIITTIFEKCYSYNYYYILY